ncbi:hypothetical protein BPOR_0247g00120 [Botrytis porri]|uniref:Cytochrome P450 n=1 Tax=Botrytis porri TaxID=87229 RepID=A0A4Z1KM49_9HELO|nr:hypothetical protein BPOR_0247g00120 [Botrytis porri]
MHQKLGSAVIHVSAGHDWLYLCDSDSVNEVFKRKDDFDRPPDLLQTVLSCFGPNVSTVQIGSVNAKLPVPHSMIKITDKDTRTFSLHVLSGAGFGKSSSFKRSTEQPEAGQTFEYRDSLALVLENCLLILVLGPKLVSKLSWPPKWKRIGQATVGFKFCMAEMLKDKKEAIAHGKPRSATFTSSLLRASKEQSQLSSNGSAPSGFQGLTEEEIYANLFVYNFAGHDTTAVVLNWTIYLLAAHPEVQDWISKEMNAIITNDINGVNWLETMRLYNLLIGTCKSTFERPQPLTVDGRTITIPPDTRIIANSNALHSHPRYWGNNCLEWHPQRWVLAKTENTQSSPVEREYIRIPPKGSYQPWSDSIRTCPGKKFSQVEFVAAMVALFKRNRVEIVREEGKTKEEAKDRVMSVVKDIVIVVLLQMRSPEKVGVRWVSRV